MLHVSYVAVAQRMIVNATIIGLILIWGNDLFSFPRFDQDKARLSSAIKRVETVPLRNCPRTLTTTLYVLKHTTYGLVVAKLKFLYVL